MGPKENRLLVKFIIDKRVIIPKNFPTADKKMNIPKNICLQFAICKYRVDLYFT